jgi:hypothetical protein
MARAPKTAPVETVETDEVEDVTVEPTTKQLISEGIVTVIEATGVDSQKARYKAMRAIAYQAFQEAIESGDFDDLVQRAIDNSGELPSGWELERPVKEEATEAPAKPAKAAKTATAKATPAKTATAKTAKAATAKTTRPRPTR